MFSFFFIAEPESSLTIHQSCINFQVKQPSHDNRSRFNLAKRNSRCLISHAHSAHAFVLISVDMCIDFMETLAHNHEKSASIQLCPEIFSFTKEKALSEHSALSLVATTCDGFLVEVLFQWSLTWVFNWYWMECIKPSFPVRRNQPKGRLGPGFQQRWLPCTNQVLI